jgi:hypothetical protein
MGFVQSDIYMRKHEEKITQLTRVDFHLKGNDSTKISKNLKLPTCASISVQMASDLETLQNGFCLEYEKLSNTQAVFQNHNWFGRYGWSLNSNLPKLQ